MWSCFDRVDVPHLGNTTNNRLEAAWGHVKDVLKPTITPDAELHKLAKETTYTTRELQPHMVEMISTVDMTRKYHLDTKTYQFSCIFTRTELLTYLLASACR
ncbi:hypothetical protein PC117_g9987 [Phytophthora cactorum]|uniref:Uncharacterized protein n=1 Tax=Phytophthora cactorum TaxID=29920 RepID=A0A8T1DK96_9STRA|nr:hypothetical protein PC117_g9987 [Phytophthora cactorum]